MCIWNIRLIDLTRNWLHSWLNYEHKIIGYFISLNFSQHCKFTCIHNVYEFLLFDDIWPSNQISSAITLLKGRPRLLRALWLNFFEIVRNIRRKLHNNICDISHGNATLGDNVTRQLTQLRGYNSINRWQGEERSDQSIPSPVPRKASNLKN